MQKTAYLLLIACAAAALAGCVARSRSLAEAPVPIDITREGRVDIVNVDYVPVMRKVTAEFPTIFTTKVKRRLDRCAQGTRALRLDASVTDYVRTNAVTSTLLVGRNRIRGVAVLTDLQTGRVVGRYKIDRTFVGRYGVLAMGPAQDQLSAAFGGEVCRKAFGGPAD